jgi:hypothetical protein
MAEWLETDSLSGFASGTVAGPRTRPTGRFVLVNGLDDCVDNATGITPTTTRENHRERFRREVSAPAAGVAEYRGLT